MSKAQALSVCKVLEMVQQCLYSLGKPHLFQAPCILFLQELLACQKDFTRYICWKCFQLKWNNKLCILYINTKVSHRIDICDFEQQCPKVCNYGITVQICVLDAKLIVVMLKQIALVSVHAYDSIGGAKFMPLWRLLFVFSKIILTVQYIWISCRLWEGN